MDERETKFLEMKREVVRRGGDGDAVVEAYRELYGLHEIGLCSWLARLFDPDIGGFYYSNSGRDCDYIEWDGKGCYTKPDMESTQQAISLMKGSGMIDSYDDIPLWMKEKLRDFACSLLDPEDGYIYHPQWGKDIGHSRRGRDLVAAEGLAKLLDFKLPYPTATERMKAATAEKNDTPATTPALPDYLKSREAFIKYMEKLDWEAPSGLGAYGAGNNLASQCYLIRSAGLGDVACDFLDSIQHKDTAIWGVQEGYAAINAIFKIGVVYGAMGRALPNAERIASRGMDIIIADELNRTVCYQFNAWWTMKICQDNLRAYGGEEGKKKAEEIEAEMLRRAPECILATKKKTAPFKCPDGSYSYYYDCTGPISQGAIVSRMIKEGDVNASIINSYSILARTLGVLRLEKFAPKIYGKEGRDAFFSALRMPKM